MRILDEVVSCFAGQKVYNRQVSDLAQIVTVIQSDLGHYGTERIIKALQDWRLKSPEFPTVFDLSELLKIAPRPNIAKMKPRDYFND